MNQNDPKTDPQKQPPTEAPLASSGLAVRSSVRAGFTKPGTRLGIVIDITGAG